MMYELRSAAGLTGGGRNQISRECLSRCHAQFDGSGPCKQIMGKSPTEGFCPGAIMDEARGTSKLGVVVPTGFEPVF